MASWLDGIYLLWFPFRQYESRKTSFWLLLLSSFSHTAKRKCCMLTLAYSHQCAQLFSISPQSLLNPRLHKSISGDINVSPSLGTQFTMPPVDDYAHCTPGEGEKAFKTHGSPWADQAVCQGKVLCILSFITLARTISSVPSGTSAPTVPIHQKSITSVPSSTLVTSVTTVPIHQRTITSIPSGTLAPSAPSTSIHQRTITSAPSGTLVTSATTVTSVPIHQRTIRNDRHSHRFHSSIYYIKYTNRFKHNNRFIDYLRQFIARV